jgi:hypothetical protein
LPDREEIYAYLQDSKRDKDPFLSQLLRRRRISLAALTLAAQGLDLRNSSAPAPGAGQRGKDIQRVVAPCTRPRRQLLKKSGIMEFVENEVRPEQVGRHGVP